MTMNVMFIICFLVGWNEGATLPQDLEVQKEKIIKKILTITPSKLAVYMDISLGLHH